MIKGQIDDSIIFRCAIAQGEIEGRKFDVSISFGGKYVMVGIQGGSIVRFDMRDIVGETLEILKREGKISLCPGA